MANNQKNRLCQHWLFKSEPTEFGVDDFAPGHLEPWEGIRNYQARNYLRDQVKVGDQVFLYQSSCATPGITGVMRVAKAAYPDPFQYKPSSKYFDPKSTREKPRWLCVDVELVKKIEPVIELSKLRTVKGLSGMTLLQKGTRLSIQPVKQEHWVIICALAGLKSARFLR